MKVTGSTIEQLEKGRPKSRCRKWRIWATTDHGRKSRRFAGTYTQALDAQKAFVTELEGTVPNAETFAAYADSWLAYRERTGEYDYNTLATDARNVRALERSPAGARRLDATTPETCRSDLLWVKEHPQRPDLAAGDVLSGTTMAKVYRVYRQILQQAVDDGRLASNPMARVKDPKIDTPEREALPWDRVQELLDKLEEKPPSAYVVLVHAIACFGLRRSEACALMDGDVDRWACTVRYAVKERTGAVGDPKSAAGVRDLPMVPRFWSLAQRWRAVKASKGLADAPTLACSVRGGVVRPQNLYRWWVSEAPAMGFGGVGLHQLRHSNLTRMARHMSAYDLMRYAGWSSLDPARIYVHDDFDSVSRGVALAWSDHGVAAWRAPGASERTKNAPDGSSDGKAAV